VRQLQQHNPLWRVTDEDGAVRRVYACDEMQAARFLLDRYGLAAVAVVMVGIGGEPDGHPDRLPR
jgi:hypothetical protein